MKRLLKRIALVGNDIISDFLQKWFYRHEETKNSDQTLIDQIVTENKDCMYNGLCYRFIQTEEFNFNVDVKNEAELAQELEKVKGNVRNIDKYTSFAMTTEAAEDYMKASGLGRGIIISANINGLSIPALAEKGKKETNSAEIEMLADAIEDEKEVLTIEPVSSFEIIAIVFDEMDIEWL